MGCGSWSRRSTPSTWWRSNTGSARVGSGRRTRRGARPTSSSTCSSRVQTDSHRAALTPRSRTWAACWRRWQRRTGWCSRPRSPASTWRRRSTYLATPSDIPSSVPRTWRRSAGSLPRRSPRSAWIRSGWSRPGCSGWPFPSIRTAMTWWAPGKAWRRWPVRSSSSSLQTSTRRRTAHWWSLGMWTPQPCSHSWKRPLAWSRRPGTRCPRSCRPRMVPPPRRERRLRATAARPTSASASRPRRSPRRMSMLWMCW